MKKQKLEDLKDFVKSKTGQDHYKDPKEGHDIVSTGFYTLDEVLEGGLRTGTYVEFFGPESSGKTFLSLNIAKQGQQVLQKPVLYMDFERAWNPERAKQIGLDLDYVVHVVPPTLEKGYDLLIDEVKTNNYSVVIVDSLTAMVPEPEEEKSMSQQSVALNARGNSKGLRKLTPGLNDTIVIFINQIRENVGVMYGDPLTTSGGRSLGHYAHHRIKISANKPQDREEEDYYDQTIGGMKKTKVDPGHVMRIKVPKTKFSNPKTAKKGCDLYYSYDLNDVDRLSDVIAYLSNKKLITTAGPSVKVSGLEKSLKGKRKLREFLENNPDEVNRLVEEASHITSDGEVVEEVEEELG